MLRLQADAKKAGYSDVVYLDAKTDTYLEEVSSCNIFTVSGKTIRTPALKVRLAFGSWVAGRLPPVQQPCCMYITACKDAHAEGCSCRRLSAPCC